jgi:ParB family chromosome partitioning protein
MASTQSKLQQLEQNLDESIGVRPLESSRPQLSPVASPKDVGRRPLRNVGRIRIDQVIPDPAQPRKEFPPGSIDRLAQSMRDRGQLAPIRVRWSAASKRWIIVCGERRWRAARVAGLETVDCCFDDREPSDAEILELQMIENLLRDDLSPIEQARGFSALMELHGWNGKQVAESLHIPTSTVSRALALLDLPKDIQQKVNAGEIAARSAYEISKVADDQQRRQLAEMATEGMTLDETREAVRKQRGKKNRTRKKGHPAGVSLMFSTENGFTVTFSSKHKVNYHEVLESLQLAAEEVQLRIENNVQIY